MKNNQYIRRAQYKKGFIVPMLLAIIALLVIGGGAYIYKNKKVEAPVVENRTEEVSTSEISVEGIVVHNNLEDNSIGAYLQIKRNDSGEDIYVLYAPFRNMKESNCLNKINATEIGVGTLVDVRGVKIDKIDGEKPKTLMISTCESLDYYIQVGDKVPTITN